MTSLPGRFAMWLRALVQRQRVETEMEKEMRLHLDLEIEANIRAGLSPEEARRAAHLSFGGVEKSKEEVRDQRGTRWIEHAFGDLRFALRGFRKSPGFAIAVVLTLALGIGANTTIFSILNAAVLRPLPYPRPQQILSLSLADEQQDHGVVDDRTLQGWVETARSFASLAAYGGRLVTIGTSEGVAQFRGLRVTHGYFQVLGVPPLLGRVFTERETERGAVPVVVLSEQLWRGTFGSDSGLVGRTIGLNDVATTVIGIMPASYTTTSGTRLWLPLDARPAAPDLVNESVMIFFYSVIGRVRDGTALDAARAELQTIHQRVEQPGGRDGMQVVAKTLHERRYGDSRRPLVLLQAAVGVLLLIACANLANLSLARSARRQREFALRLALGASRWRLSQYVLIESLMLSAFGAMLGLALARSSVRVLVAMSPGTVGNLENVGLDGTVLAFTLIVAAMTGLFFGLVPAIVAARGDVNQALASGSARASAGPRQRLMRHALIVGELASALVFLTGAGLVAKTFWRVTSIETGFRPENVLTAHVRLPSTRYSDAAGDAFIRELLARVRRDPRVLSASLVDVPPLGGRAMTVTHTDEIRKTSTEFDVVTADAGYFETISATLIAGRPIMESDRPGTPRVAVVSETLARMAFAGEQAIGKTLDVQGGPLTIVGVVRDVLQRGLEEPPMPTLFRAMAQAGAVNSADLVLRTDGDATLMQEPIRRALLEMDRSLLPPPFLTMDQALGEAMAPRRFSLVVLGIFALLAGLLAVIGLYGVLSYLVSERTRELAIRAALGADAARVMRLVLRHGMLLVAAGTALGVGASMLAVRLLRSMVYEMSVYDPWAFASAAVALMGVALLASYLPARWASRLDPLTALRAE
ncbi:MAG: ABC transporter permease [Gemmatimonadaceae bacterium]